jgi:hypothetical protein
LAGLTGQASATSINRLDNCTIDGDLAETTGTNQLFLSGCKVGTSVASVQNVGQWGTFNCRNTIFGPKTTGSIALNGSLVGMQLDAMSERSLFSAFNGRATIGSSANSFIALDEGESSATPMQAISATYTFARDRLFMPLTTLAGSVTATLSLTGAAALDFLPIDVYGTNGNTITVQFNAVTIKTIPSTDSFPSRYLFQASEDNALVVFVGTEVL